MRSVSTARGRASRGGPGEASRLCFIPLGQALVAHTAARDNAGLADLSCSRGPLNALAHDRGRNAAPRATDAPAPWTVHDAVRSAPFWWLALARFAGAFAFPLMNTHVIAYAIGQGVTPAVAATALGTVSLVSLAGRLTTGWLSDRIGRAPTLTIMYASAAIGIGCLAVMAATGAPVWLTLYDGAGSPDRRLPAPPSLAGDRRRISGGRLATAGEALGAWLGGRIFDTTGSYVPAFALVVIALLIGCAAMWRVHAPGGLGDPSRSPM